MTLIPPRITLGIEGIEVFTDTIDTFGNDKSISLIKDDLVRALRIAGFAQAFGDPLSGFMFIPDVSTGNPLGGSELDLGATFLSTDSDLGGFAKISVPDSGSVVLFPLSVALLAVCRRRRAEVAGPANLAVAGET